MEEIELIGKRKPREKHFLQKDGTIIARVYDTDIHYLKDGRYEEIDNTLVKENGSLVNKSNDYKVEFKENFKDSLMKMSKDDYYIDFKIRDSKISNLNSEKRNLSKQMKNITYNNITDDITIEYQTLANKVKETIVLQNATHSELSFELDTNLKLSEQNGEIIAKNISEKVIFRIEKPFMVDSNNIRNDNIHYSIVSFDDGYLLTLVLDDEWLNSSERKFPVYIDPTITNEGQSIELYDTYIYPGDTGVDKGTKDILKAGVERINGVDKINRTLIKFTLPTIGTGSEIISADLTLIPYISSLDKAVDDFKYLTVHRITEDWTESDATWDKMNNKFDERVECVMPCKRSDIKDSSISYFVTGPEITTLVRKWYRDTPNYGIMLKSVDETYIDEDYPAFFSKNNTVNGDPKPYLSIYYRNQNGLEKYLDYKKQYFTNSSTYVNTYNGNLVGVFNVGHTVGGQLPADVNLIYNTNDVVLNNETSFGKGYKLNVEQTIKQVTIDNAEYLEYIDEDGTIHYFIKESSLYSVNPNKNDSLYCDEDGLGLKLEKSDSQCVITDNNGNKNVFIKKEDKYLLSQIKDTNENKITIEFDSNNRIIKITDSNNLNISFKYNDNNIVISSPNRVVKLYYNNKQLSSIETPDGITNIKYNTNDIISEITDVNGMKITYEYYSKKPYRLKKVTQYGLNNTLGQSFSLDYDFEATTITDNKERCETLIFNSYGNVLSRNSLGSSEDISNAYSIIQEYGDGSDFESLNKNKIISSTAPVKYIKNYLKNSGFFDDNDYFIGMPKLTKSFCSDVSFIGNRSLKIETTANNQSLTRYITVPLGKSYTFSGYFKNENNILLSLSYVDATGEEKSSSVSIEPSTEFDRNDITIYYDENATSDIKLEILFLDKGITYLDAIQLEEGEVANKYNIIENSDFSEGYNDWDVSVTDKSGNDLDPNDTFKVIDINNGKNKVLKVKMNPKQNSSFSKKLHISGKKGDLYTISFWYKNEGVAECMPNAGNIMSIYYRPTDGNAEYCISQFQLERKENTWQYISLSDVALEDFESIIIGFYQGLNANDFYITNISFTKETTHGQFSYDENGNLVSIKNQSNEETTFKYDKNNQLISATSPIGDNFKYEYDNIDKTRVLSAISSTEISNQIKYDNKGNPISTIISKKGINELVDGKYRIRSKGTNKYLKAELNSVLLEENPCSNTIWNFEKVGENFKIFYSILPDFYISYENDNIFLSDNISNNIFTLEHMENGSYKIGVNIKEGFAKKYIVANNSEVSLAYSDDDSLDEFYIEPIEDLFMETDATYSDDGRFITSVTDSNFNTITYETDEITGLTKSMTNPQGQITTYKYNNKEQLTEVEVNDKKITYNYNDKNLLDKILQENKEYNFYYDDFLNTTKTAIGDNITLSTNAFEKNNGNLISTTYGNNHTVTFDYDEFDRLKTTHNMDDNYHYIYDNSGNIAKILSNNHIEKYSYDINNRIYKYKYDDFKIDYTYDSNNNVINKRYKLSNANHSLKNIINKDDMLTKLILDSRNIYYSYDSLGRLTSRDIISGHYTSYEYISNGKRTTPLIKSIIHKFGEYEKHYEYKYDKLNNITHLYYNDELIKEYSYDEYSELICENDYINNIKIEYTYDNFGNLLSKITKYIHNGDTITTDIYQYQNSDWKDQLTKYNGESITYDEIGNPLTIGNDVGMTWINGRQLSSYTNLSKNLSIKYKYNDDGIRESKIINNIKTKYFLEDDDIIFEQRGTDLIYYLYDLTGILGLEYNGNVYYYVKNLQGDIIGILNSNCEQIVTYEYDSWGKLLSIKDSSGNVITDENNIGMINPFRYRSYYYDNETGLYYLNNRYYNPDWCRFLNADGILGANEDIMSYNLYAYVSNNPISSYDLKGNFALSAIFASVAAKICLAAAVAIAIPKAIKATTAIISNIKSNVATQSKVKTKTTTAKSKPKNNNDNNHNVYTLRDKNTGVVEYVGRTTKLENAQYRHNRNPFRTDLKFNPEAIGISKETARGLEQMFIIECKTLNRNRNFPRNNQINGLAENHQNYPIYWDAAMAWANMPENEIKCN